MTKKNKTKEKRAYGWAVVDTSRTLFPRKDYIDITCRGSTLAIYLSKTDAKEQHHTFRGREIVPCTITYKIPNKEKHGL